MFAHRPSQLCTMDLRTKLSEGGGTLVQLLIINCKGGFIGNVDLVSVTNVPTHFSE